MSFIKHAPLALALCLGSAAAQAQEVPRGCAAKKQAIEREIAYARETGNTQRLRGLERALSASQDCNDAQLQREREDKVRAAEAKVKEREAELAEEKAEGKVKDIAKAQRKLDEARHELQQARAEVYR
ncbi:DUF1090 domain-containing protein [Bordetella pseudohinzii]|uniref:Protein of uncharacterized function (DUF1090) n=1 Tax=Bordetella pseudohinzii TaxID=1331258 RepID=A0A0M7D9A7_9BORD|nr:DUF1090 domain-containing protein [Bordetella pseudohinzii]ANY15215.1 hypothetical protein BBN53_04485 [Bordetella pseudohinzii]KXA76388.1 hypothetical protein AW877_17130 [Bordetella pseudohinzii]KXA79487.1 hypothetical protein AW878_09795 [Bordetella pseudohinzii]CUI50270.1 Protein of uncharacterised function (DUF1090) [Bordetella pseudohinzii]